jgi:hypothetical protein
MERTITQHDVDMAKVERDACGLAYHKLDLECGYESNPDTRFEMKKGLNPLYNAWDDAKEAFYRLTEDFSAQKLKQKEAKAWVEMNKILENIAAKQKRTEELHRKTLELNEIALAEKRKAAGGEVLDGE